MDLSLLEKNYQLIGTDEVGRGPIAGPVVACAVSIEPTSFETLKLLEKLGVTDSKKLTSKKRIAILETLGIDLLKLKTEKIYSTPSFSFILTSEDSETIDNINILKASLKCMKRASDALLKENSYLLIDGNKTFESKAQKIEAVIKGDSKSLTIALASIIAKEFRDEKMRELSLIYPGYGLESHAGYPTAKHKLALEMLGVTPVHRKSYAPVKSILQRT